MTMLQKKCLLFSKSNLTCTSISIILTLLACTDTNKIVEEIKPTTENDTITELPNIPFIDDIPDYTQYDMKGENTDNGKQFCAPTAVSNSLFWLHKNMEHDYLETELLYPNHSLQEGIILQLASEFYMSTNLKNGTSVAQLLAGVDKYVTEKFGGYQKLEYEGRHKHQSEYTIDEKQPNMYRLQAFIHQKSAAWLNIGWYEYDKSNNEYIRKDGHWVTLVGYDNNQFIIHDPSSSHKNNKHEFITYSILRDGQIIDDDKGLPQETNGYLQLTDGLNIPSEFDAAILDGVVYLEL